MLVLDIRTFKITLGESAKLSAYWEGAIGTPLLTVSVHRSHR